MSSKKIAVIDNYDSFVYNLVRYVRELSGTEPVVFRNDRIDYDVLETCDGILLSPGPGLPSAAGELLQVIERYENRKSILGICLGHQAIGEYFGGQLMHCSTPIHGKASIITHSGGVLFQNLNSSFEVGRYHSWCIAAQLPECLFGNAESEDKILMAIHHKTKPIYGVQFHPESILTPSGRQIIANWIKQV